MEHVHYMTSNKLDRATQNYVIAFTVELLGFSFEGGGGTLFLGNHAYLNSTTDSFLLNNNDPYIMV